MLPDPQSILQFARGLQPELVALRRSVHASPCLSGREEPTREVIESFCVAQGWQTRRMDKSAGLVVDIPGEGTPVGLRADIDALPGPEESALPFASTGTAAHLCGHDLHIATALGAGLAVSALDNRPAVRLVFQPEEEAPPGGALRMIEEGALDGLCGIFAVHVDPQSDCGMVSTRSGAYFAAPDNFEIVLTGEGGHAAMPHRASDMLTAAADLILSAQTASSRATDPFDPAVISFATVQGGTNFNVLPGTVTLRGTVRTFSDAARQRTNRLLASLAGEISARYRGSATVRLIRGYDPLVNSPEAVRTGCAVASSLFGDGMVNPDTAPVMFGEDFCYYTQKIPGAFFMIGAGVDGQRYPLHNSRVVFNEDVLWRAAAFLAAVAHAWGREKCS